MLYLSGFLNHCNGAEGTLDSGDLLQVQARSSGKGGTRVNPGTHCTLETNKQTYALYLQRDAKALKLPPLLYMLPFVKLCALVFFYAYFLVNLVPFNYEFHGKHENARVSIEM